LDALVQALQVNCGDRFDACRRAMVSPMFLEQWMKDDKDVQAQITEAERVGALSLQSAAIQRAVHGVEKGVYFKGERVDTEIQYSDGLLTTLLKGRLPEIYGPDTEGKGNTFNGPTQINIMPRANSYDEWLAMKDATLTRRDKLDAEEKAAKALPAPVEGSRPHALGPFIELEAMPVPASPFEGLGL
jgi:hypothetical protein